LASAAQEGVVEQSPSAANWRNQAGWCRARMSRSPQNAGRSARISLKTSGPSSGEMPAGPHGLVGSAPAARRAARHSMVTRAGRQHRRNWPGAGLLPVVATRAGSACRPAPTRSPPPRPGVGGRSSAREPSRVRPPTNAVPAMRRRRADRRSTCGSADQISGAAVNASGRALDRQRRRQRPHVAGGSIRAR